MIVKKILLLFLLLTACGENGTDESVVYDGGRTVPVPEISEDETITYELLKRVVLDPWNCIDCHIQGGGGTSWGSDVDTVRKTIIDSKIVPGDPERSSLYVRSKGSNPQTMPPQTNSYSDKKGPVDEQGLEYIRRFIEGLDTD